MSSFTQAGAAPEPTSYAPLLTNRMQTGLWTNRNPLRDAAVPYLLERGGGGRQDSIWAGLNTEISSRLTLIRRPGHTVYNSQSFPPINRFYEFHLFSATSESIRVMVDTADTVWDGTGPSTKLNIWNKAAGAGSTTFLSVGNTLYFFNGLEAKKWLQSLVTWAAAGPYTQGTYLIDAAGNVQQATTGGVSGPGPTAFSPTLGGTWTDGTVVWTNRGAAVQAMQPAAPPTAPTVTQAGTPQVIPAWSPRTYYSTSYLIQNTDGYIFKAIVFGTTGTTEPTWNEATNAPTTDNTVIWSCQGSGAYLSSHNYFAGSYIVAADSNGNKFFFQAGPGGVTGATPPTFPSALGAVVSDGAMVWTNVGVQASWGSITGTSLVGNFGIIPVLGGGRVCIGCGAGPNGSYIALPTGFTTERMVGWSTAAGPPGSAQVSGVFDSHVSGGAVSSSWRNRSGGVAFSSGSNWIAAAWSADANVTVTTSGGVTFATFTTLAGDPLSIACGRMGAGTLSAPTGFLAADAVAIAGMATTATTTNGMQVEICYFDPTLTLTAQYRDSDGHVWQGQANVFAVFFQPGGGVNTVSVTGGSAITIPTALGSSVALVMASGGDGDTFGVPAGFNSFFGTVSFRNQRDDPSDHIAHGAQYLAVTGNTIHARFTDGSGNQWGALANVFAVAAYQAQTSVTSVQEVQDVNGGLQKVIVSGVSSNPGPPLWQVTQGALTVDNGVTWLLSGTTTIASTAAWTYWYDFQNEVDRSASSASPVSAGLTLAAGYYGLVQGAYSTDPQVHTVRIFRTVQGGSTPFLLDTVPNNPAGGQWSYQDTTQDKDLNELIQAAVADELDVPPVGAVAPCYHLQRVFVAVENTVQWSEGGAAVLFSANGNSGFPPLNSITFPSRVVRMWACALGLVVFTVANSYLILGTATAGDPLYAVPFLDGLGLLSYDAFCTQGSTAYLITNSKQLVSLDPGAGKLEVGFPIADQIDALFSEQSHLVWHSQSSADTALYAGDGFYGWFRMSAATPPETGFAWSPQAVLNQGCRALSSVQVTPGQNRLLCGQSTTGPILMRDNSVRRDNGSTYDAWTVFGSIVIASPGEIGNLRFFTLDGIKIGSRPTLGLLLGEISGRFETLRRSRQDPTDLPPAATLFSDRYYVAQNRLPAYCRHFQLQVNFGDEDAPNELLTFTVFGGVSAEMKAGL